MPAEEPPENRQRLPNRFTGWRVFGFLLACVVLLIAALVLRENITGRRALEKARQRWADAGFPLDLEKRRPVPIPDEENFAAVPSLHDVIEVYDDHFGDFALNGPLAAGAPKTHYQRLTLDPALVEAWDKAADRPQARFPIFDGDVAFQPREYPMDWLRLSTCLTDLGKKALDGGQPATAASRFRIVARFSDALAARSTVDALRWVCEERQAMELRIKERIQARRWDEPSLAPLAPHLAMFSDEQLLQTLADAVAFEDARTQKLSRTDPKRLITEIAGPSRFNGLALLIPTGWWEHNRAVLLNIQLDHLLKPVRRSGAVGPCRERMALTSAHIFAMGASGRMGFKMHRHAVLAAQDATWRHLVATETVASDQFAGRMMALAVAVERFRLAEGRIPDAATDVVPRFLSAVPLDVDGRPLRFQKRSEGFVIYSVGADGKDSWHGTPPKPVEWPEDWDDDWLLDFSPR